MFIRSYNFLALNSPLKLVCFLLLSANYSMYLFHQRLCSRLMALWRYINFVLLLLLYSIGDVVCFSVTSR